MAEVENYLKGISDVTGALNYAQSCASQSAMRQDFA